MESIKAFAMGEANRGRELKVFDWDRAAEIIRERGATSAGAGLSGDWEWTGGRILADGKPDMDDYTYLASTWATPELEIDGEIIDCYRMQSETPGWDSGTKWPDSAVAILDGTPRKATP
ncbi:hypothetical protein H8E07_10110 [bacterium]|nr:hypothetical protein [bacterium]